MNEVIRQQTKKAGLYQWEVAEGLGISESTYCKHMRRELPDDERERVLEVIERLKATKAKQ